MTATEFKERSAHHLAHNAEDQYVYRVGDTIRQSYFVDRLITLHIAARLGLKGDTYTRYWENLNT